MSPTCHLSPQTEGCVFKPEELTARPTPRAASSPMHTLTHVHTCTRMQGVHMDVCPSTCARVPLTRTHDAWGLQVGKPSCPASGGAPVPMQLTHTCLGSHGSTSQTHAAVPGAGPGPSRPMLPGGGAGRPPGTPGSSAPSQGLTSPENSPSFCQMPSLAPGLMPGLGLHAGPSVPTRGQ